MANVFDYIFNLKGDYTVKINGMSESTAEFQASVNKSQKALEGLGQKAIGLEAISNVLRNMNDAISTFSEGGIKLDSQMHDLSAVAGVVGEDLKKIEGYARESAKAFGTDASVAVEGYKLLLGQLTPELAKCPEALKSMGESVQITSKLMGNDGVAAAEVLTTAMNQYGVSLDDPMAASRKMAEMMNVMAAAGQEGSAELPAIKVALEQCGMAAKAANVSFEETNAAIQVLDKAGKKGSEGGVALRNVLAILGQGRFLPEKTQEELAAAGIDINELADTSKSLKDRLELLKPVLNDAALFSKLFGMENANAARALVQGREELGRLTTAISGTSSAEEQAEVVMESYAERQARVNQQIEDFKISVFQATGDLSIWLTTMSGLLVPLSQLTPLISGVHILMKKIKLLNWAGMWSKIRVNIALMAGTMQSGSMISLGFVGNIGRATLALLRFGTVGIFNALKGVGALILSFITGGTASATFSTIASTAFWTFATSAKVACRAVGVAIMNIPIVGWIAAAVAGLIALGVYFWNTSVKFRAVLKGLWAAFKAYFSGIWDLAKNVFGAIGDLIKACFELKPDGIKAALNKFKNAYSDFGSQIGKAFTEAYNAEMAAGEKNAAEEQKKENAQIALPKIDEPPATIEGTSPTGKTLSGVGGSAAGKSGGTIRNITVSVDKLIERLEIHTTTIKEGVGEIQAMVSEALLQALNDTNLAAR